MGNTSKIIAREKYSWDKKSKKLKNTILQLLTVHEERSNMDNLGKPAQKSRTKQSRWNIPLFELSEIDDIFQPLSEYIHWNH